MESISPKKGFSLFVLNAYKKSPSSLQKIKADYSLNHI